LAVLGISPGSLVGGDELESHVTERDSPPHQLLGGSSICERTLCALCKRIDAGLHRAVQI
jgi:hypothetical protein